MVIASLFTGCGFSWSDIEYASKADVNASRKEIDDVKRDVALVIECQEELVASGQRTEANVSGLRTEFEEHRTTTVDALGKLRASQFTEAEKQTIKDELQRRKDERRAEVSGDAGALMSISPSPSDPPRYQQPPQQQALIPVLRQQQPPQQRCWWCAKCRCWHYRN